MRFVKVPLQQKENRLFSENKNTLMLMVIYLPSLIGKSVMGMLSKSAKVKLKAILIIDVIIIAAAAGAYLYLQNNGVIANTPKPATFTLSDLNIDPTTAEVYDPILITFNITNIGNLQGSYIANLTIDNVPTQNQTINLDGGGNSTIAQFTVSEETPGNYTAAIGDLTGSFTVTPLTATSSTIKLSNLSFNPTEAWVNQPVNATVDADNEGTDNSTLRVLLTVDSSVVQSKTIELAAGEISKLAFSFNLTTQGVHHIKVGTLSDTVTVVPTGYHTLEVGRTGQGSTPVPFTLNGVSHNTFYTALLPVGNYTIVMPNPLTISTGVLAFANWQDGDTNPTKTIDLEGWTFEIVSYTLVSGQASCPSLYTWNGTANHYVTDVSNPGWLGYIGGIEPNGNIVFSGGNPWDYVKLDPTQLATKTLDGNTFYDLTLAQQWDELFYLDAAKLVVVDHPAGTDVYTTMTNYLNKGSTGQVYTVNSNTLLSPIAATNQNGQNVLPDILKQDGVYTPGTNVFDSSSWNNMTLNQLTLDLGNLSSAKQIKLVVTGIVDWGPYQSYYNWIDQFQSAAAKGLITKYTPITPAPTMEIKQANGTWTLAPQDRQIPIPSDYNPRTFVVDLTGLFPKGISDYQIRFTNVWNVTYDYIGIDTSNQANINVQTLSPTSATLSQFWSTN